MKQIVVIMVSAFPGGIEPDKWHDDLSLCPSQCYYATKKNGIDYIMYLRWRWSDPWQAHIVTGATSKEGMHDDNAIWSEDLFAAAGLHITHDDLQYAKDKITDILWRRMNDLP